MVFLRAQQVALLLDMAASSSATDQQLWDAVARVPLEPLLPNRSLASRLRALLIDCGAQIRELVKEQGAHEPPPSETLDTEPGEAPSGDDPFGTHS